MTEEIVESPDHYNQSDIECIDGIKAQLSKQGYLGFLHGNIVKYIWRWEKKQRVDSLKKARWYLQRLLKEEGHNE